MRGNKYHIHTIAVNLQIDVEKYEALWYQFNKKGMYEVDEDISEMYYRIRNTIELELINLESKYPFLKEEEEDYTTKALDIAEKENLLKMYPNGKLLYYPFYFNN